MKLTHISYKNKVASTPVNPSFRRRLLNFINQHTGAFEALARNGTPFGGSCLPMNRTASAAQPNKLAGQLLWSRRGQSGAADRPAGVKELGINRFRTLQTES